MKKKMMDVWKENKKFRTGFAAIALSIAVGATSLMLTQKQPEFPAYEDPEVVVQIEEEETPLALPVVKTKTTSKTTKKNVKLAKAATKTYSKTLPTTTKKSTTSKKTETSVANITTKTDTTVATSVKEAYKKSSKYKTVTTTVKTTVKTTTTTIAKKTAAAKTLPNGSYTLQELAPKTEEKVKYAFTTLGFKMEINSKVNYSGKYDTKIRTITLRKFDDCVYHELGHFLGFIAGNIDRSAGFQAVYNAEKEKYVGNNKAYVIQNSSEYFAESYRDYILNTEVLKSTRPKTYEQIQKALSMITPTRVAQYGSIYKNYWK